MPTYLIFVQHFISVVGVEETGYECEGVSPDAVVVVQKKTVIVLREWCTDDYDSSLPHSAASSLFR